MEDRFCKAQNFFSFPKEIVIGTDPVALDHVLIDMIEAEAAARGSALDL